MLTDGRLYFDAKGKALKVFHVRDGHGIKLAQRAGIKVALLSGRRSDAAYHRAKELGISRFHEGLRDKVAVLEEIMAAMQIQASQVAMVGDDLVDLPIMSRAGAGGGGGRRRPEVLAAPIGSPHYPAATGPSARSAICLSRPRGSGGRS